MRLAFGHSMVRLIKRYEVTRRRLGNILGINNKRPMNCNLEARGLSVVLVESCCLSVSTREFQLCGHVFRAILTEDHPSLSFFAIGRVDAHTFLTWK
jgi:hypothetical protein